MLLVVVSEVHIVLIPDSDVALFIVHFNMTSTG